MPNLDEKPENQEQILDSEKKPQEKIPEEITNVEIEGGEAEADEIKKAPRWVKDLRKLQRETAKENRLLRKQIKEAASSSEDLPELGPEPTLEGCDHDTDKWKSEFLKWTEKKRIADNQKQDKINKATEQDKKWKNKLIAHKQMSDVLNFSDYSEAEEAIKEELSEIQQGIIIDATDNSALVMYALGKNQSKLKEIAEIKNPIKFTAAIIKLEGKLKITKTKPAVSPEESIPAEGAAALSIGDTVLEKLRAEAEKTGDFSGIHKHNMELKKKARS